MPKIDSTAKVHSKAELAEDVVIGPYSIVGEHARIGPRTVVESHCVIAGRTELGADNHIGPFASIGLPPQDITYRGEPTRLVIGDGNNIREYVTINRATMKGGGITILGNNNMLMACAHVAHDCVVGDRTILSNCALLAGHVKLEDGAILSGLCAVHHFVTIGSVAMLGGLTGVTHDVPPFMMMLIDHRVPRCVNVVGMKRNGYSDEEVKSVQRAFRLIYRSKLSWSEAAEELAVAGTVTRPVQRVIDFLQRQESGKLGRHLETTRWEHGGAT